MKYKINSSLNQFYVLKEKEPKLFYNKMKPHSNVKKTLVNKYFSAWARIMNVHSKSDKLGYIDLFCGPGKYDSGEESTPIEVMKQILNNENYRNKFVTIFNDKSKGNINKLKSEIYKLENINLLKYKPVFLNLELDIKASDIFKDTQIIPSLIFIDPWGYKGVSQELIYSLTKDWGCDAILFFNYNRISSAINNPVVEKHMKALFGEKRYLELDDMLKYNRTDKENLIINEFGEAMRDIGIEYVLPFKFKDELRDRTSHYIIFLSKNFTAFKIMKEIMASSSSDSLEGVASFEYIANNNKQLSFLYDYSAPLAELGNDLLHTYAGKSITFEQLFYEHSRNNRFIEKNYREILINLEKEGKIQCNPSTCERRKNTLSKNVKIIFPPAENI